MAVYIKKTISGVPKGIPLTTDSGQGLPLGAITAFYGTTPPNGYLLCDGSEFSTTDYPALYTFLGDNHTPDLRNKVLMGANPSSQTSPASGNTSDVRDIQNAQLPRITGGLAQILGETSIHSSGAFTLSNSGNPAAPGGSDNHWSSITFDSSRLGASTDHLGNNVYTANGETRPANVRVNYIIKAVIGPIEDSAADQILQQCINYNSPDWANAQSITLSTSDYVVPDDGWIVGTGLNPSNSQIVKILINGIAVESSIGVTSYHSLPSIQVKVNKGDIVKLNTGSIGSQDFHFVPHK